MSWTTWLACSVSVTPDFSSARSAGPPRRLGSGMLISTHTESPWTKSSGRDVRQLSLAQKIKCRNVTCARFAVGRGGVHDRDDERVQTSAMGTHVNSVTNSLSHLAILCRRDLHIELLLVVKE